MTLKTVYAAATATSVTAIVVTVVTVVAEESPVFKDWLASLTGHHWVTKSLGSLVLFLILTPLIARVAAPTGRAVRQSVAGAIVSTALGSVILLAYYAGHFFGWW